MGLPLEGVGRVALCFEVVMRLEAMHMKALQVSTIWPVALYHGREGERILCRFCLFHIQILMERDISCGIGFHDV